MRTLYPEIQPFRSEQLSVDGLHHVYFEESGNKHGIPVVFLHGGPGSGSNENHRRYFDPSRYYIINFDQRGCNRSTPNGCTELNTSQHLIADIELIRRHLDIEHWLIFGGSWGAMLALLYAEAHPARVRGMVLRGTFLGRQRDLDWFINDGANRIFPDYWQEFVQAVPEHERHDLVSAYHRRVHGDNKQEQVAAATAWAKWAGRIVTYMLAGVNPDSYQVENIEQTIHEVSIETHYASNAYFINENQVLDEIANVPGVPVCIIHGRRDLTCTLDASWELHRALPGSKLVIVRDGGHLAGETPMVDALITATDEMAELLG